MDIVRKKKVKQFLKKPMVALGYIYKLYKAKGFKEFSKDIYHKLIFVVKSLWPSRT